MTTFELNAEIYHNLGLISNDKDKLLKVLKAIKDIVWSRSEHPSLEFPHLPSDFHISQKVRDGAIGELPNGVDFNKETDKMWEEWAK